MPCCRDFSVIFLKSHALTGFSANESVSKRHRDTSHYIDPIISTV